MLRQKPIILFLAIISSTTFTTSFCYAQKTNAKKPTLLTIPSIPSENLKLKSKQLAAHRKKTKRKRKTIRYVLLGASILTIGVALLGYHCYKSFGRDVGRATGQAVEIICVEGVRACIEGIVPQNPSALTKTPT